VFGEESTNGQGEPETASISPSADKGLSDTEIVSKALTASNGERFSRLWAGDASGYGSHSEADLALCGMLAFWSGGVAARIDALFRQSGLYRKKWEREDYRERTIAEALKGKSEFYVPPKTVTLAGGTSGPTDGPEPEGKEERPTQAQLLVRCAAGAELFHTPSGEAYASVPVGDHRETHLVKSKGFRRWLVRGYFDQHDRPPGAQALQDALGLLEARAQFDGFDREVHVRVAGTEGAVYVDLANERWEVAEITPGGWRVVPGERAPVRFRRSRGMLALPTPVQGGDDGDGLDGLLQDFINVAEIDALKLVIAWLLQALRPTGPYPVLLFQGEQGSAKSTAERLVRSLVDPSTAPLRTTPRSERDLVIAATNSWCVAFDNISTLQPWLSDAMCRLSTGGGFSARELYTDSEEVLFDATRPLLLNGITDVATRPDLLDRALTVTLPPISEEKRRPEAALWREFERHGRASWPCSSTPSPGRSPRSRACGSKACHGWRISPCGSRRRRRPSAGSRERSWPHTTATGRRPRRARSRQTPWPLPSRSSWKAGKSGRGRRASCGTFSMDSSRTASNTPRPGPVLRTP
jgi:hypothetical protein